MDRFSGSIQREFNGTQLTLVMDFNAAIFFEDETGLDFFETVEAWGDDDAKLPVKQVRHFVHAALQEHHAEMSLKDAGKLFSADVDLVRRLMEATTKGVEVAPEGKKKKAAR
ncbi:hypothetical protein [uncultured Roseobacter sp.]|uniref:hypothetical protein n=1 Tax=uncultured Roseobacter sp. TaxID=114847 RepID=UPI00260C3F8F|nr:hypothetical protein [uncultured Roseobacter sp.]